MRNPDCGFVILANFLDKARVDRVFKNTTRAAQPAKKAYHLRS
jgi:hypothetical protein